jgi:hypothetical protein
MQEGRLFPFFRYAVALVEPELTEDQLAQSAASDKKLVLGFALGVAAANATDVTQRIVDCAKRFKDADVYRVRGRAAVVSALAALPEFGGI